MGSLPTDQHPQSITRLYGRQLRERRDKASLTQKQAAEAAGVSQATISRWEAGSEQPDYKSFYALAAAYGCKMSELLPRNQYPSAPLDPVARLDWVRRRNAAIQGVDEDEYMKMMEAQDERVRQHGSEPRKEKP
jgi:transcriptional regulator with XRE-family HTH domain